jgi:hypothetical protein
MRVMKRSTGGTPKKVLCLSSLNTAMNSPP